MRHSIKSNVGRLFSIASASTFLALSACSSDANSTGLGAKGSSQLAFVAVPSGTASAAVAPVTVGTHTLDLSKASITVSRAELKRASTDACAGDDDDDNGGGDDHPGSNSGSGSCGTLKVGPTTVDLPLSGSVVTLPAKSIPAGTYREVELRVSQVELTGTFDGKAFDVTLPVVVKSEIEFATPLVVTDTSATSVTVSVPVQTWLMNADGSLIDPNTIAASPTLSAQIAARIRASFRAFEDRDHDGHDDRGHDGRGNGGNSGPG